MIVLGIDASLTCTGFAVVDVADAARQRVLHTARVRTSPKDGSDTFRARNIAAAAVCAAKDCEAQVVGLEIPYLDPAKAGNVALRMSRLGAIIESALIDAGFSVVQVAAATTGSMLGIKGQHVKRPERKKQAIAAVQSRYGVTVTNDEADAVGVALGAYRNYRRAAA